MPNPTGEPCPPHQRRTFRRRTARLLVLDEFDHVLLFRDSDLGVDPVPHWWMTPGGGVDPGESDRDAAARELDEETGLVVKGEEVFGPLAERRVLHGYSDVVVDQEEVFFGVRTTRFTPAPTAFAEEEAACIIETRWFSRADLEVLEEDLWPANVVAMLEHWEAMAEDPALPPLALPDSEESVVPVTAPTPTTPTPPTL